ncbi:hypothetical protein CW304_00365 [Bacillus sp. UFRGS-B20]|nr:hypothetical protein CW304_00365 [Bacillus sp. UFRGS-B20]
MGETYQPQAKVKSDTISIFISFPPVKNANHPMLKYQIHFSFKLIIHFNPILLYINLNVVHFEHTY